MTAGLPASSDLHWPLAARFLEGWLFEWNSACRRPVAGCASKLGRPGGWWWGVLDLVLDAQAGDDVGIRGRMASSASRACVSLLEGCGAVSLFGSVALRGQCTCWPQRSCERCRNKHDNSLGGRASTLSGTLMRRRRASSMARSPCKMSQDDQRAKSPRIISHRRPGRAVAGSRRPGPRCWWLSYAVISSVPTISRGSSSSSSFKHTGAQWPP